MSLAHDIDNEEPFFQFDPYEGSSSRLFSTVTIAPPSSITLDLHRGMDPSERLHELEEGSSGGVGKGKAVTRPVPIGAPTTAVYDFFDMSPSDSTSSPTGPSLPIAHSMPLDEAQNFKSFIQSNVEGSLEPTSPLDDSAGIAVSGKGKAREVPPMLPPLTFSPTEFGYDETSWLSSEVISSSPGPSSYGSSSGPSATQIPNFETFSPCAVGPVPSSNLVDISSSPGRLPSRRHSFSNLSVRSTRSLAARSMTKIKVKFGSSRSPSSLARKLLGQKYDVDASIPFRDRVNDKEANGADPTVALPSYLCTYLELNVQAPKPQSLPIRGFLKGKGRSYSSPLPFSALDYVPTTTTDIFAAIPFVIKNYFEEILPKELRLHVLHSFIALHEDEHRRAVEEGRWTVTKASSSKSRWVGRDKAMQELVRLSRVSKSWQSLVFDGQLWDNLDLRSFPELSKSLILRLTKSGGAFVRNVDVAGHIYLLPSTLSAMSDNLCLTQSAIPYTQLTSVNLRGCSGLTTRSLHHLLVRSRSLQKLCLKGLTTVTNMTCDIVAAYCPQLVTLDMSRCPNMDAGGIRNLANAAISRGEYMQLRELRVCGLKHVNDAMMFALGKAAPYLEVLDLSYVRQLHNSALEAFVACGDDEAPGFETILVPGHELGRESSDFTRYRRRVTRLRHLSLSSCVLLTDTACSNLVQSVPRLEFLELAGIGGDLKDDGLIRLLSTTPMIKRLDLEDASGITDAVLATITPALLDLEADANTPQLADPKPEPGHALEQLVISYASEITDTALLALIRRCSRLNTLEADNTRMGSMVLREFIRLSRKRRAMDAKIIAIDCRGIGESLVKSFSDSTRPRLGWCAYDARKLKYLDGRDGNDDDLKIGQDECDEKRVVLKTFYSWQTVDAVKAAREKRRKSGRRDSSGSMDLDNLSGRSARWWTPGGRRSGRSSPPTMADMNGDGCIMM